MIKIVSERYENSTGAAHDDMLGILGTGITGANQWNVKVINDTFIPVGFLRNNSSDFAIVRIQSPHWRKQGVALDSIHLHYVLDQAATAGQTILFTTYWTWVTPGAVIPAIASWNTVPKTMTLGTTGAWHHSIETLVSAPAAPAADNYGMYLLVRVVRENGTYTGEIGVIDIDAHAKKDRLGSNLEASDV